MTDRILYCYDDEEIEKANENMERLGIRRMPIIDRQKRLAGILSLGDLSFTQTERSGTTLKSVARPH
jgi:CBS domain-containing protein